jgi:hypothetical protein
MQTLLLASMLLFSSLQSCEKQEAYGQVNHIKVQSSLENIKLYYCSKCFFVKHNDTIVELSAHNMDSELQNINEEQLNAVLEHGYLTLSKIDNNEYYLRCHIKGLGGNKFMWMALKFVIESVVKEAIINPLVKHAVKYYNNYQHPDANQVQKVKNAHHQEAVNVIAKIYDELEKNGMLNEECASYRRYENGYVEMIPGTNLPVKAIIKGQERKIRDEIIMKIAEQVLCNKVPNADYMLTCMRKSVVGL